MPSLIYAQIIGNRQSLSFQTKEDEEVWLEGILIAKGKRLSGRVETFIKDEIKDENNIAAVFEIVKTEKKASDAQPRLQQEVRKLITRIECGEPLLGGCDTCPKIYIQPKLGQRLDTGEDGKAR